MRIDLSSDLRKVVFITVFLVAVSLYIGAISYHSLAVQLETQSDPGSLGQAVHLDPWNAEPHWKLGRYLLFVAQDPTHAVERLGTAVRLNPYVAQYWLDLASGYHVSGEVQRQRSALEHALRAEPTDPNVAWQAANFYLLQDDLAHALPLFRVVMNNDPALLSSALRLCWHATQNVQVMLNKALPPEPAAYFTFLSLLTNQGKTPSAEEVWGRLLRLSHGFPLVDAYPYFDYLIKNHQIAAAEQVWQQLAERNRELQTYSQPGNLIVDGGFERDFLNGGFDWRYTVIDPVQLSIDTGEFQSGGQSLRMNFKGPGVDDIGIFEYVPVLPSTQYQFSTYTKAQDVESASGPRLSVADAYSGESYVLTNDSLGTTGWRQLMADFRTGPQTSLLTLKVTRVPGSPLIKGTFWIDDVKLVRVEKKGDSS
jgi:tetratricopeptide (TPR) repeat protein